MDLHKDDKEISVISNEVYLEIQYENAQGLEKSARSK